MPPQTGAPGHPPQVTIALATYGRPDALACAVRSVLLQSFGDWHLLVIGDACGPETAEAMTRRFSLSDQCLPWAAPSWCIAQIPVKTLELFLLCNPV